MKRLALALAMALVALPAVAAPLDVCLKITGTKAQVRAALTALGLDREMLRRNEAGALVITGSNHHVAIDLWMRPVLQFGTYGIDENGDIVEITPPVFANRPYLRIRFLSPQAKRKARRKIIEAGGLPAGLERVACPATRKWFGEP